MAEVGTLARTASIQSLSALSPSATLTLSVAMTVPFSLRRKVFVPALSNER